MIAGSHSSTLDRLYAWERKLYDEVKVYLSHRTTHYTKKCIRVSRYTFSHLSWYYFKELQCPCYDFMSSL